MFVRRLQVELKLCQIDVINCGLERQDWNGTVIV